MLCVLEIRRAREVALQVPGDVRECRPSLGTMTRSARLASLAVAAFAMAMTGCGAPLSGSPPGPGVPHISNLRLRPERVNAGCPVTVSVHFSDANADVMRVLVLLSDQPGQVDHFVTLPVDSAELTGRSSGVVNGVLTLGHYGRHQLHLQVEDAAGRRSNVLREVVIVAPPLPWTAKRCR